MQFGKCRKNASCAIYNVEGLWPIQRKGYVYKNKNKKEEKKLGVSSCPWCVTRNESAWAKGCLNEDIWPLDYILIEKTDERLCLLKD